MSVARRMLTACLLAALVASGVSAGEPRPLIVRSAPDPARQATAQTWLARLDAARPALARAVAALERERDGWSSSAGTGRCRRAYRAMAAVDRKALSAGHYTLVSTLGAALDELDGAIAACLARRYFELDYRLSLAGRGLGEAHALAVAGAGG